MPGRVTDFAWSRRPGAVGRVQILRPGPGAWVLEFGPREVES